RAASQTAGHGNVRNREAGERAALSGVNAGLAERFAARRRAATHSIRGVRSTKTRAAFGSVLTRLPVVVAWTTPGVRLRSGIVARLPTVVERRRRIRLEHGHAPLASTERRRTNDEHRAEQATSHFALGSRQ